MSFWFQLAVLTALGLIWFAIADGVSRIEKLLAQISVLLDRD